MLRRLLFLTDEDESAGLEEEDDTDEDVMDEVELYFVGCEIVSGLDEGFLPLDLECALEFVAIGVDVDF